MAIILEDEMLLKVEKPSRYTGNEWNMVVKNLDEVDSRFAFCFPDTYEVGMSHLGMRILYHLLNEQKGIYCERVFAPWVDMEAAMRERGIPLFSLETKSPVSEFDIVGFTLQYEMSYTNILNMLDLAGIPLKSEDRENGMPFVCAGGPCAYNPEPLADFIDFFMMGEGEEIILEVMQLYSEWKKLGQSREQFLLDLTKIEGIYVPSLYNTVYNEDGTLKENKPIAAGIPSKIKKRIIKNLEQVFYPEKIIVPFTDIVHDRVMLELFRGCIRGCRFCQAGYIYRPVREKSPERLKELANKLIDNTGYEEISLTSLSTSDYTNFNGLADGLIDEMEPKMVNISLPSLRVDSFNIELMEKAQKVRKSGLTFAPEAGTQRLRDVINKGVTEEDLGNSVSLAFNGGWSTVKLYFMMGLPTETMDDIEGISKLAFFVVNKYMEIPKTYRAKALKVNVSTSSFVPKPFTPFQWEAQDTILQLSEKQRLLQSKLKSKFISYSWHEPKLSLLEAVFARGDRRVCEVLHEAWKNGAKFDGWGEHFKYDVWINAFEKCGIDPAFYANRIRNSEEVFPWDIIDIGVTKDFLLSEKEKAYAEKTTQNCRTNCNACGAECFGADICY
jgi:radical SAM family uncharacterized protein